MVAAGLDRADVVRAAAGARRRLEGHLIVVADLKALTAIMDDGTGGAAERPPSGGVSAGRDAAYRYNELIGTQGGLTALHFAARQGSARR